MGFRIVEGYGLTETFGPITICPDGDLRPGSVGTILPENEMRISNPDKEGRGEVLFRGATVFAGYYRNGEATQKAFDHEGFFHTGDLGRVTRDGFLYLTGRAKDVIVLPSGKNVYPEELEAFYSRSRLIEEIGVFGAKSGNEESVAAVILSARELRKRYSPGEIRDLIAAELRRMDKALPSYRKVADFCLTTQPLPRTSTRKIKKAELTRFYEASKPSARTREIGQVKPTVAEEELMKTEEYREIAESLISARPDLKTARITPRTNLEMDLMMDSLSRIDFLSWLEKTAGVGMGEKTLLKMETIQDAIQWLMEAKKSAPQAAPMTAGPDRDITSIMERIKDNQGLILFSGPAVVAGLSRIFWGFKVHGAHHIPVAGPVIFCANHGSYLDAAWIVSAFPWTLRRKTFTLGKIELLDNPVTAFLVRRSNMVAVEREGDVMTPFHVAEKILSDRKNLLVFPEGTRTRTGKMGLFRPGIGMLMIKTGVPVVPLKIQGSSALWPAGGMPRLLAGRGKKAALFIGPARSLADLGDTGEGTVTHRAEMISQRLKAIVEEM
jgi:long-chain acyl-CoA synthetase